VEPKKTNPKIHDNASRDAGPAASTKAIQVVDRARHTMREITTTVARAEGTVARQTTLPSFRKSG
jgi:hypothetical protein